MSLDALPEKLDVLQEPIYGPYRMAHGLLRPGMNVLDVGCGNAKVSAFLATSGAQVDEIEPSASRSSVAAKNLRHLSTVPAGGDDPMLLDSYDLITFFDVVEHIPDPAPILAWAANKLAPGGAILASIPNSGHWSFRKKMLRGDWRMHDWGLFDRTHLRFFDITTMQELRPSGLAAESVHYFTPATSGIEPVAVKRWPALFALHAVWVWRRHA